MKLENVKSIKVSDCKDIKEACLMDQEIEGTKVSYISLKKSEIYTAQPSSSFISIFILCNGSASFQSNEKNDLQKEPGVYVPYVHHSVTITATSDSEFLKLDRYINTEELKSVEADYASFPHSVLFSEAPRYTEDCKSSKTISRMIIPARLIPRFAMGSVQTSGDDLVAKHTHPILEQFFFGLKTNHCKILIDNIECPFEDNHLVHIPLGSNHGVLSKGKDEINYLWMDFLFDESSLKYMDEAHKIIK